MKWLKFGGQMSKVMITVSSKNIFMDIHLLVLGE